MRAAWNPVQCADRLQAQRSCAVGLFSAIMLLAPIGCAPVAPQLVQVVPDPPHAMEFVHQAKTVYELRPAGAAIRVWWRTVSDEGVVEHPVSVVRAGERGRFDVFLTSCEALRFFRGPLRASIVHDGQRNGFELARGEELLHAGTVRPVHALQPGRAVVLQQARYFLPDNPHFAGGLGRSAPSPQVPADVVVELWAMLIE
ncbi:MAG: hypothetical protein HRU75_05275 [Planctomycetia bacterium]|nr:MAG: hypothetical protein HRU75_05275 [Planctomycetia bacterium]